jgi:hypothetical protein
MSRVMTMGVVGCLACVACVASAAGDDVFEMYWSTLDGGGGVLVGDDYELMGTIGQPDAVTLLTGDDVELMGGFWVADGAPSRPPRADFNRDGFIDFFDYDDFLEAFELGRAGADFNRDGFIDFFDYDAFVAAFEGGG